MIHVEDHAAQHTLSDGKINNNNNNDNNNNDENISVSLFWLFFIPLSGTSIKQEEEKNSR